MAYKNSGQLNAQDKYVLGIYEFEINRRVEEIVIDDQTVTVTIISITCTDVETGEKRYARNVARGDVEIEHWWIEANDTTADVYWSTQGENFPEVQTSYEKPITFVHEIYTLTSIYVPGGGTYYTEAIRSTSDKMIISETPSVNITYCSERESITVFKKSRTKRFSTGEWSDWTNTIETVSLTDFVTIDNKKAYYKKSDLGSVLEYGIEPYRTAPTNNDIWWVVYNDSPIFHSEDRLAARFDINLREAGGTGSSSDWYEPGDWNDTPYSVLNLTVNGALSGRHNDPLNNNANYSYLPADQDSVAGYGCGGDGGHGGGGGAGASTIIVNQFSTDKANSKTIVAKPKRHGYGSGGGKGGKGGDGCILIFY